MKLIEEVLAVIEDGSFGWEKYSQLMAEALYSACVRSAPGPNFLALATNLDSANLELVRRLSQINREPDYSNEDQAQAAQLLREKYGLGTPEYQFV
jgi:hypothetical protein